MGFLDRAIKNGISKGISEAVGKAVGDSVKNVIQPKVNQAAQNYTNAVTKNINEAAKELNEAAAQANTASAQTRSEVEKIDTSELEKAFSTLNSIAENAVKDKKECPNCGQLVSSDKDFCPSCGTKLPELTLSEYAVCPSCGKQNDIGTKFCAGCGAKLPLKLAEEEAAAESDRAVLEKWDEVLSNYPKWCFGGCDYSIDENGCDDEGNPYYIFSASDVGQAELDKYVDLLKQNGFIRPAGYSFDESLYKVINGKCYAFNKTEALSSDRMCINFYIGDFDKKEEKAQPAKKSGLLGGLFGF